MDECARDTVCARGLGVEWRSRWKRECLQQVKEAHRGMSRAKEGEGRRDKVGRRVKKAWGEWGKGNRG